MSPTRLITWSAPIAAGVACLGVAEIFYPGDLLLAGLLLLAALAILILPALHPAAPEDDASTAPSPTMGGSPVTAAGAIEAAPAATRNTRA